MSVQSQTLDIRCFAEGRRIPVTSVSRQQQLGSPPMFNISIPASPTAMQILPGTVFHIFVERPTTGDQQVAGAPTEYCMFGECRLIGKQMSLSPQGMRTLMLQAEGLDAEWGRQRLGGGDFPMSGWPRPRLLNFFFGLSATDKVGATGEHLSLIPGQAESTKLKLLRTLSGNAGLIDGFWSTTSQFEKQIGEVGIATAVNDLIVNVPRHNPLLRQRAKAMRLYKRYVFSQNNRITNFLKDEYINKALKQQLSAAPLEGTVSSIIDAFLTYSFHHRVMIASPSFTAGHFEAAARYAQELSEEEGAIEVEKPQPASWANLTGEARIQAALEDPAVQAFLDLIAWHEIGEDAGRAGPVKLPAKDPADKGYATGYGFRAVDINSADHPYAEGATPIQVFFIDENGEKDSTVIGPSDTIPDWLAIQGAAYGLEMPESAPSTNVLSSGAKPQVRPLRDLLELEFRRGKDLDPKYDRYEIDGEEYLITRANPPGTTGVFPREIVDPDTLEPTGVYVAQEDAILAARIRDASRIVKDDSGRRLDTSKDRPIKPVTASGRYQFTRDTWADTKQYAEDIGAQPMSTFGPADQDRAAVLLMEQAGILDYLAEGSFNEALHASARKWASLPCPNDRGCYDKEEFDNQKARNTTAEMYEQYNELLASRGGTDRAIVLSATNREALKLAKENAQAGNMPMHLIKPFLRFSPPPVCNIVFPEEIMGMSGQHDFLMSPTRMMIESQPFYEGSGLLNDMTGLTYAHMAPKAIKDITDPIRPGKAFGDIVTSAAEAQQYENRLKSIEQEYIDKLKSEAENNTLDTQAIAALANAKSSKPIQLLLAQDDIMAPILTGKAEMSKPLKLADIVEVPDIEEPGKGNNLLSMFTYEELYKGIVPQLARFPFTDNKTEDTEDESGDDRPRSSSLYGRYNHAIMSQQGRGCTLELRYQPDVVPGFPMVAFDRSFGWIYGEVASIQDTISAEGAGASTVVTLGNVTFLAEIERPEWRGIYNSALGEVNPLGVAAGSEFGTFYDEDYSARLIGEKLYRPLLSVGSLIDLIDQVEEALSEDEQKAFRLIIEEAGNKGELTMESALKALAYVYQSNSDAALWLRGIKRRPVVTEGQFFSLVLESQPVSDEEAAEITLANARYAQSEAWGTTYRSYEIPEEAAFMQERREWADRYVADARVREFALNNKTAFSF